MNVQSATYKFAAYEFSPRQHELRAGEIRIALPVSLNRLLLLFVTHPGEVVTRQQIADALWEEHATIDVVAGINTAVKRLRTNLADSGSLIETVVGVGYRFMAPVSVIPAGSSGFDADVEQATSSAALDRTEDEEPGDLVTDDAGEGSGLPLAATEPALLSTASEEVKRRKLWQRWAVAAAAVVLLTTATAAGWNYFSSVSSRRAELRPATDVLFLVRPYPLTFDEPEDQLTAQAISPSGAYLAYADRSGLTLRALSGNQEKRLDMPKEFRVESLAWFPDESAVLASGTLQPGGNTGNAAPKSQTWVVSLSGTQSHMLLDDAATACISPDGLSVAWLRGGRTEVWVASAKGEGARKLAAAGTGDAFSALLWSPQSDRIVVDRSPSGIQTFPSADLDGSTAPASGVKTGADKLEDGVYESYDAKTGALRSRHTGMRFESAVLLRDGSLLYAPNQMDKGSMILAHTDPDTGKVLDQRLQSTDLTSAYWTYRMAQLSGTRNGDTISVMVDRRAVNVYTADMVTPRGSDHPQLENIARLSFHAGTAYPTGWTPDGRNVLFDNSTSAGVSVAKQGVDGSPLQNLVTSGNYDLTYTRGQFSPDGKWLLFQEFLNGRAISINRIPANGGTPEALHTTGKIEEFHCSASPAGRCVLREIEGKTALVYYALDPVTGIGAELGRVPWEVNVYGDWSLSPDGRTVAMANHDPQHPSIQLVTLSPAALSQPEQGTAAMKDIPLQGFGTAFSAHWSTDGKAIFVEAFKAPDYELVWVSLDGRTSLLYQSPDLIWAVPSPDGKKIAFPYVTALNHNVWVGKANWQAVSGK